MKKILKESLSKVCDGLSIIIKIKNKNVIAYRYWLLDAKAKINNN